MKNKLYSALLLISALAATTHTRAQGFIGNGTSSGIKAVNSSGTLPGVNVGIGVATPAAGTTLEVADPGAGTLGLKFDNLPSSTTPYVLYYDGTSTVTYGAAGSGSISSVDYDCGVGTVTVNGVSSANKAWLLSGATTTAGSYLGTFNDDDIRIATANGACGLNGLKQKMIIGSETNLGNVAIGWDGVTPLPTPVGAGFSKFSVQNGVVSATPFAAGLATISSLVGVTVSGADVAVAAHANQTSGPVNIGIASFSDDPATQNSVGFIGVVNNATSSNNGMVLVVDGNNTSNNGGSISVGNFSTTTNDNNGLNIDVTGSSVTNKGLSARTSGTTNFLNNAVYGGASDAVWTNYNNPQGNIGVWGDAKSGAGVTNTVNTAVKGDAYGDGSFNSGFMTNSGGNNNAINVGGVLLTDGENNNSWSGPGSYYTGWQANVGYFANAQGQNSVNIGGMGRATDGTDIYGLIGSGVANTCNSQIGVWGYLLSAPNGSIANYAVRGTAPYGGTGGGVFAPTSGSSPVAPSYAGYFEGDVFATNTYYYSDPKLKENVSDYKGALDLLSQLSIKRYTFRNSEYPFMNLPQGEQVGVLSTELKKVCPGLVKPAVHLSTKKGEPQVSFEAVNYNAFIPVLIQAVKELNAKPENPELEKKVADQQAQIATQSQLLTDQARQLTELRSMIDDLCTNGCAGFNPRGSAQPVPAQGASLYQSVPNPASGTVSIGYSISMSYTTAAISIITLDGKSVSDYKVSGIGTGSVSFDTRSLAAGTYKYYLTIDGKIIDTKTMAVANK